MKILIFGRKPVSCDALRYARRKGVTIAGVVTPLLDPTDCYGERLADLAESFGIPIFSPDSIYAAIRGEVEPRVDLTEIDAIFSVLHQQRILPPIVGHGRLGCINFHPAPLPAFRGWGTYNYAILEDVRRWAVTAHFVDEDFDTGPIIRSREFEVDCSKETAWSLQLRTQPELLALFIEVFDDLLAGRTLVGRPQGPGRSFRKKEVLDLRFIGPTDSAEAVDKKVRAFWYPPNPVGELTLQRSAYTLITPEIIGGLAPVINTRGYNLAISRPPRIPAVRVDFSEADRREISYRIDKALTQGQLAQGINVDELEARFSRITGARHAMALSSGGRPLEAAMRALRVCGKEVLLPTNTFLATASCVLAAGGTVKLLDIDAATLAPSPTTIAGAITPSTAGVVVVHIGGIISKDILEIRRVCEERGVWLFEDCAHAHGSEFEGCSAGLFGIGGAYSLFSTKVVTSGEGGLLVTNDDAFARQIRLLRNYGKPDPWITVSTEIGFNSRLNELAAAVGLVQIKRLLEFVEARSAVAQIYDTELVGIAGLKLVRPQGRCSWYKYIAVLPPGTDRKRLKETLSQRGVMVPGGVYDLPLHRQPALSHLARQEEFPIAEDFCSRHICLPIYFGLRDDDARFVARQLKDALREVSDGE